MGASTDFFHVVFARSELDPMALAEMIRRHLPLNVRAFGIEHGVLLWKKEEWLQEMNNQAVFVMHPTVFHELLNRNYIEFAHFKLLILDECHQAIRDHAFGSIVKQYKQLWDQNANQRNLPRLFSMTTALLKMHCTPVQLEERIDNLSRFFWWAATQRLFASRIEIFRSVRRFSPRRIWSADNRIVWRKFPKKRSSFVKRRTIDRPRSRSKSFEYVHRQTFDDEVETIFLFRNFIKRWNFSINWNHRHRRVRRKIRRHWRFRVKF